MMTLKKNNKIIKYAISILLILFPFIDILRVTKLKEVEIFNIALIELINIILILISFSLTIYNNHKYKKNIINKPKIIYIIVLFIYLILHSINIYNFNINIYDKASFNFFVEIYYIFRVYLLPIMFIYVLLNNKDIFDQEYYLKYTKCMIFIISGSIVILNLFGFSYSSYADSSNPYLINHANFFDAFKYTKNFKELFTCGLFPSANQISIILVMLLPINLYNMYLKNNKTNAFLVLLQIFSMIIVGTKTAALGSLIIAISCLLMYLFFSIINKKIDKKYFLNYLFIIIISIFLIAISPFNQMVKEKKLFSTNIPNNQNEKYKEVYDNLKLLKSNEEKNKYIVKYSGVFKIDKIFFEMYPIEKDTDFWFKIANRNSNLNNNYRVMKMDIIDRIKERNNNKYDKYLGLGYTLNFMDIERDYVYQYYLFGYLGFIILVGVYIYIYILNLKEVLKKKNFTYSKCLVLVSGFFGLILCYFSGHLFGWVSPMLILAFVLSIERRIIYES